MPEILQFLRTDENKTELFCFLAQYAQKMPSEKQVISTFLQEVLCNYSRDTQELAHCNHEEADTRIFVHMKDAVNHGLSRVLIRTVDTDVVALAVTAVVQTDVKELWVAFGTGKKFRYISAHDIAAALGPDKARALPILKNGRHCFNRSNFRWLPCLTYSCWAILQVWQVSCFYEKMHN